MNTRKFTALLLSFALLLTLFTACGKKEELKTSSTLLYYGDTESKEPLHILMDIQTSEFSGSWDYSSTEKAMDELLAAIRTDIGEQDVVIEFIPHGPSDDQTARATAVSRLRVEILAGGGPDVFIMRYKETAGPEGLKLDAGDVLFKYP
ncbi:MAG: hypothetical protein J6I98_07315, partial [Clostridia bacterium]|nr:hypothetical protein [Clostridia bacterium]